MSTCYNQQDIRLVAATEDWVTMKLKYETLNQNGKTMKLAKTR